MSTDAAVGAGVAGGVASSGVWTSLLPMALVGTDKSSAAGQHWPQWPGEVGALMQQLGQSAAEPSTRLLQAAGVLATCERAGAGGQPWPQPLPALAAAEVWHTAVEVALRSAEIRQRVDPGLLFSLTRWALREGAARLQTQLCLGLRQMQLRLPEALLPLALELGRRAVAQRAALTPVLGQRGMWLAAQREEWRWAAGVATGVTNGVTDGVNEGVNEGANEVAPDESPWQHGSAVQRREFLATERAAQPAAARARLAQALPELSAKERADLLPVLAQGLSLDDEPLLDSLRADRSKDVRQVALSLLLGLPKAAHPQRAMARMQALVQQQRVLLVQRWVIDAPSAAAADWKADNVDAARPKNDALGERAWWLYQLARQVPLAWWGAHMGKTPAEVLDWAKGTDWAEALLRAWREVLLAAPEAPDAQAWCATFLAAAAAQPNTAGAMGVAQWLALLPLPLREQYWHQQLRRNEKHENLDAMVYQVLQACPPEQTLSAALSVELAQRLRQWADNGALRNDYSLRSMLPDLASALHGDALPVLSGLPKLADDTPSYTEFLHALDQTVALRQALQTLSASAPFAPIAQRTQAVHNAPPASNPTPHSTP